MIRGLSIVATWGALAATACGLERDRAAWQRASASDTDGTSTPGSTAGPTDETGESAGDPDSAASSTTGPASSTSPDDSTTDAGTTGPAAVCGNGIVEGDEECDDPGQTACFKCVRDRLVFVTSTAMFNGNFGSEAADIDLNCNYLAALAGLITNNERRFKTWISTTTESAADRLYHSPGRYVLRNGLVFAESWDAMVAGNILNPLNVDENSQTQHVIVWTDTRPDGSPMPGNHCEDWTLESFESWVYWGDSDAMDTNWTLYVGDATNPTICLDSAALYCFESP